MAEKQGVSDTREADGGSPALTSEEAAFLTEFLYESQPVVVVGTENMRSAAEVLGVTVPEPSAKKSIE